MTLEDLAAEFGVSRERVRQIEVRAFEKVQAAAKGTIARQEQTAVKDLKSPSPATRDRPGSTACSRCGARNCRARG